MSICISTKKRMALSCGRLERAFVQSLKVGVPYTELQYGVALAWYMSTMMVARNGRWRHWVSKEDIRMDVLME